MGREGDELSEKREVPQVGVQIGVAGHHRVVGFVDRKKVLVESPVNRPVRADSIPNDIGAALGTDHMCAA